MAPTTVNDHEIECAAVKESKEMKNEDSVLSCDCDLKEQEQKHDDMNEPISSKKRKNPSCDCHHLKMKTQVEEVDETFEEVDETVEDDKTVYAESDEFFLCHHGEDKVNWELWHKYNKQIRESQGFDIEDFHYGRLAAFRPFYDIGPESRVHHLAEMALKQFSLWGPMYYMTFEARKAGADSDDPLITFQARVWDAFPPDEVEVQLCRIKQSPPSSSSS